MIIVSILGPIIILLLLMKIYDPKKPVKFFGYTDSTDIHSFITPWTLMHIVSSACAQSLLVNGPLKLNPTTSAHIVLWGHFAYELKDVYITYSGMVRPQSGNTVFNSIGDQLGAVIGVLLAWRYNFGIQWIIPLLVATVFIISLPVFDKDGRWATAFTELWTERG